MLDRRYAVTDEAIFVASDARIKRALKLGTFLPKYYSSIYGRQKTVFIKEVKGDKKGHYPDFHCTLKHIQMI